MNVFEQFLALLNLLPDGDEKKAVAEAFPKLQDAFGEAVKTRDLTRTTNNELRTKIDGIKSKLGLEGDEFDLSQVDTLLESLKKPGKNDEALTKLSEKHEGELTEIRTLLQSEQEKSKGLEATNNDMLFKSEIEGKGLLEGFKDNPLLRGQVVEALKAKLLYQDGQIFVNDEGKPAKDITSGEHISPATVVDAIKKDPLYVDFLAPNGGHGSGKHSANNSGGQQKSKTFKERQQEILQG